MSVLLLIGQLAAFYYSCKLGARSSGAVYKKSKWLLLGISFVAIMSPLVILIYDGDNLSYVPQTVALALLGFGGGLSARQYNRDISL